VINNSISIGGVVLLCFSQCCILLIFGLTFFHSVSLPFNQVEATYGPIDLLDPQLSNQSSAGTTKYDVPPIIKIEYPVSGSVIPRNLINVGGGIVDPNGNLEIIEVFINKYPYDGKYSYVFTKPFMNTDGDAYNTIGKIYNWSFPVVFESSGVYRILAHAQDSSKNSRWDEINVYIPFNTSMSSTRFPLVTESLALSESSNNGNSNSTNSASSGNQTRIAIVNPTFTDAAYGPNAFYIFYEKYDRSGLYDEILPISTNITTDLEMLTAKLPEPVWIDPKTSADLAKNMSMFSRVDPDNIQIVILANRIENELPPNQSQVTVINNEDVHNGYVFGQNEESNAYDVLILNHDEYVTQEMYDNYRKFVQNGGSMIILDGNVFYAEVEYDPFNHTITLVKGHDWEFDSSRKVARPGPHERYFDENREWVGSNFLLSDINDNITFGNNPFNYTHFEDNFVNNPNVTIIIDYEARIPASNPFSGATVATYELAVGKGKVIATGIYGQNLIKDNNKEFLEFFDNLLLKSIDDS
jgi:hypothetical protein